MNAVFIADSANNKLNKAKAAVMASNLMIALMSLPVHADDVSIQVWQKAFVRVSPWILNLIIPAALLVLGSFMVAQIARCYKDYKASGEVNFGPLIVLFAAIAVLIVLRANNGYYLFKLIGMDTSGNVSNN